MAIDGKLFRYTINNTPFILTDLKEHNADLVSFSAKAYNRNMAQMNVSIPDKLKGWAEKRVAEGRYSSTSDYVRDLVRRDQEQEEARRRLQAAIDEGLASPETDATIESIIAEGRRRRAAR